MRVPSRFERATQPGLEGAALVSKVLYFMYFAPGGEQGEKTVVYINTLTSLCQLSTNQIFMKPSYQFTMQATQHCKYDMLNTGC